jgi:hypothetical protein
MRSYLAILAILLPLAVVAEQAGSISLLAGDASAHWNRAMPTKGTDASPCVPKVYLQKGQVPLLLVAAKNGGSSDKDMKKPEGGSGADLDLRYVDWDSIKEGSKGKTGNTRKKGNIKNGDIGEENGNGEKDGENGENEKDDENGKDEKDGGGGWDRLSDAPKLG